MIVRSLLLATALLALTCSAALAQSREDFIIAAPTLRANVTVSADVVRIGDVIDNAGPAAQVAIYRAPDLGTTGSLTVTQVITTLRSHQVIGVVTGDLREISVTRLARTLGAKDIEQQVARYGNAGAQRGRCDDIVAGLPEAGRHGGGEQRGGEEERAGDHG